MANRHIEAIEHKDTVYVRLDDLQAYVSALVDKAAGATGKEALRHVQEQLAALRDRRRAA